MVLSTIFRRWVGGRSLCNQKERRRGRKDPINRSITVPLTSFNPSLLITLFSSFGKSTFTPFRYCPSQVLPSRSNPAVPGYSLSLASRLTLRICQGYDDRPRDANTPLVALRSTQSLRPPDHVNYLHLPCPQRSPRVFIWPRLHTWEQRCYCPASLYPPAAVMATETRRATSRWNPLETKIRFSASISYTPTLRAGA